MSIFQRLLNKIGLRPNSDLRTYGFSDSLQVTLSTIAKHEGRPIHELLPDLVAAGLTQYRTVDELMHKWESLSPREQDVAALACLGYTNNQIAVRQGTSLQTIKTQMRSVLKKFEVENRNQLHALLAHWDFSGWTTQP